MTISARVASPSWSGPRSAAGDLAEARLYVTLAHAGGDRRRIEVRDLALAAATPSAPTGTPR